MATASSIIAGRALVLISAVDQTGKVFPKVMARFKNLNKQITALAMGGVTGFKAYKMALIDALMPLKSMSIAWGAMGQLAGFVLNTIATRLTALGRSAVSLGFQLTIAAWAMAMPLYASVQEAAKLDTALLKAKAAAELTDDEMQSLSDTVKRVSRDTTFLATEIAQVAKELARAGLKGPELEAALLPVLNLARATDYDPAKAAEQFVQAVTVFGIGVEGYQKVSDNFVTAANESIVDMEDIGAAFSYVAGSAEATRFGLTRTLAALAQLSFSGLTGSKGGTSLNQFLESIGDKADDIKEAFGVETFLPTGELRNPLEILMDLSKVLNAMPDDQKLPHLTRIFNVRGARAVKALKSLENLNDMIEKMNTQIGVSADQAKILDRGFEGSFRRISRSVSGFRIEVGEAFRKPLAKLAADLEIVFDKMGTWVKANHKVVASIGVMLIQLAAAGAALLAFGIAAQVTAYALSGLTLASKALGNAIAGLEAILLLFGFGAAATAETAAVSSFGAAITALATALGVSFGWAVAIVIAGATAIVTAIATISTTIFYLVSLVKEDLATAFVIVGSKFSEVWGLLEKDIQGLIFEITRLWQHIKPYVIARLKNAINAVTMVLVLLIESLKEGGRQLQWITFFLSLLNNVIDAFVITLKALGAAIDSYFIQPLKEALEILKEIMGINAIKRLFGAETKAILKDLSPQQAEPEVTKLPEDPNTRLLRERLELLKKQKELLDGGLGNTSTAASITIERNSAANVEAIFRDQQQQKSLSVLEQIEDRLRVIEIQQRMNQPAFGGI